MFSGGGGIGRKSVEERASGEPTAADTLADV